MRNRKVRKQPMIDRILNNIIGQWVIAIAVILVLGFAGGAVRNFVYALVG